MTRRPDAANAAISVRCTPTGEPTQFVRGRRLYVVRAVLAHWREATRWWSRGSGSGLDIAPTAIDRDVWRVEASIGRSGTPGVFDLARLTRPVQAQPAGVQPVSGEAAAAVREYWELVRVID